MNKDWSDQDRTGEFHQQYDLNLESESSLPPRSRLHRRSEKKKKNFTFSFPVIRLLVILFFLLIIAALTSPYWLT
jgi:hypothetical protein